MASLCPVLTSPRVAGVSRVFAPCQRIGRRHVRVAAFGQRNKQPDPQSQVTQSQKIALSSEFVASIIIGVALSTEIYMSTTELKSELTTLMSEVKAELGTVEVILKADITTLKSEFKADITTLKSEFKADITTLKADIQTLSNKFDLADQKYNDLKVSNSAVSALTKRLEQEVTVLEMHKN